MAVSASDTAIQGTRAMHGTGPAGAGPGPAQGSTFSGVSPAASGLQPLGPVVGVYSSYESCLGGDLRHQP